MSDTIDALRRLAAARPRDEAIRDAGGATADYGTLCRRVFGAASVWAGLPPVVGIFAQSSLDWTVSYLALTQAGKTIVPIPVFFSDAQIAHVVGDSGTLHILASGPLLQRAGSFGLPLSSVETPAMAPGTASPAAAADNGAPGGARSIIYTSGSTGAPKGVRMGARQISHSTAALAKAIGAGPDDVYLSALPLSLLLEQLCAIHVPIFAGARVVIAGEPSTGAAIAAAAEAADPTISVLVPQLLGAWVAALEASSRRPGAHLRVVATGGARVSEAIAERAWRVGIPVHEGYGLSECCAVVSLNRPGERVAGTVGRPLPGVTVVLDDGEIVVSGPTVMDGYLNAGPEPGRLWRTGDLGAFAPGGQLVVLGRKDSMLVTAAGRNVVPEWIEAMVLADPRVACAVLIAGTDSDLLAVVVPHGPFVELFAEMSRTALEAWFASLVAAAPAYARPRRVALLSPKDLSENGLLTGNGRPRRGRIAAFVAASSDTRYVL